MAHKPLEGVRDVNVESARNQRVEQVDEDAAVPLLQPKACVAARMLTPAAALGCMQLHLNRNAKRVAARMLNSVADHACMQLHLNHIVKWVAARMLNPVAAHACLQLYLNYKLKSVAHLPWRQMTYKFLNTIIDDLFAFVIKMPTLHRLSVFRCGGCCRY
jgi:hypothetical protein